MAGTEAPYPQWKAPQTKHLPQKVEGSSIISFVAGAPAVMGRMTLHPFGGLTYEEWIETPLAPSEFPMHNPSGHWDDQESLGNEILRVCKEKKISASEAADLVIA